MNVHYARPGQIGPDYRNGSRLQALCGAAFVPTVHNGSLPVCPACLSAFCDAHPGSAGRSRGRPGRPRAGSIQRDIRAVG